MRSECIQKYELNNQPIWFGSLSKISGKEISSPQNYELRLLKPSDAHAMGILSEKIYRNLKKGEECFIHKHEKSYYAQAFADRNLHYIGVFVHGRLVGMSYVRVCANQRAFEDEIPGSPEGVISATPQNPVATFGSDCILPEYRGNKMNQMMVQFRLHLARRLGCAYAASIIDRKNHWNMTPYFSNGFHMYATAVDPSDNGKIALMSLPLRQESNLKQKAQFTIRLPYNRNRLIDFALMNGFLGVSFDSKTSEITFQMPYQNVRKAVQRSYRFNALYQLAKRKEYTRV